MIIITWNNKNQMILTRYKMIIKIKEIMIVRMPKQFNNRQKNNKSKVDHCINIKKMISFITIKFKYLLFN